MSESEESKDVALIKKILGVILLAGIGAFFLLKPGDVVLTGGRWDLTFPIFSKIPIGVGALMVAASIYLEGKHPSIEKILSRGGEALVALGFILSFVLQ